MTLLIPLVLEAAAQTPAPAPPPPATVEPAPAPPATEAPAPDEPPLAIPGHSPAPRRPPARAAEGDPASEAAHARAVREYRSRYLSVRPIAEARLGTTYSYGWYGGPGPWGGGWVALPAPFFSVQEDFAVFQGPARIDVPTTLGALGDTTGKEQLERRIRAKRTASGLLYGLGAAGLVGTIAGVVGSDQASTYGELATWNTVTWTGVGLMVGGFIGGSFPASRAHRLQHEPEATFELPELQRRIEDHNQALADELGLDPMEAVRLEGATAPPPR